MKTGKICVEKFNDINANGIRDAGEVMLPGWTFTRTGNGLPSQAAVTGPDGKACFDAPPGGYTVTETLKLGWTSTSPGGSNPARSTSVVGSQTVTLKFGNRQPPTLGRVCVYKYEDKNANGQKDPGEGWLGGWKFELSSGQVGQTDEKGRICWDLPPGDYAVNEAMQPGWVSTDPGGSAPMKPFKIIAGAATSVYFGNRPTKPANAKLCVTKYWDKDVNGTFNGADTRLGGWTFTLSNGMTGTTNDQGHYCWTLPVGNYTVTETMKPGWISSDPGGPNPSKSINLVAPGAELMFGNRKIF